MYDAIAEMNLGYHSKLQVVLSVDHQPEAHLFGLGFSPISVEIRFTRSWRVAVRLWSLAIWSRDPLSEND